MQKEPSRRDSSARPTSSASGRCAFSTFLPDPAFCSPSVCRLRVRAHTSPPKKPAPVALIVTGSCPWTLGCDPLPTWIEHWCVSHRLQEKLVDTQPGVLVDSGLVPPSLPAPTLLPYMGGRSRAGAPATAMLERAVMPPWPPSHKHRVHGGGWVRPWRRRAGGRGWAQSLPHPAQAHPVAPHAGPRCRCAARGAGSPPILFARSHSPAWLFYPRLPVS